MIGPYTPSPLILSGDKLEIAIQNGIRARQLLESDAAKSVLKLLQDRYIGNWIAEKTTEHRESAWYHYQALLAFEKELLTMVSNGKFAEAQLKEKSDG